MTAAFAPLDPASYRDLVKRALVEDLGSGDITTNALSGQNEQAIAKLGKGDLQKLVTGDETWSVV